MEYNEASMTNVTTERTRRSTRTHPRSAIIEVVEVGDSRYVNLYGIVCLSSRERSSDKTYLQSSRALITIRHTAMT